MLDSFPEALFRDDLINWKIPANKISILLFQLPGIFDKFILFSSSGNDNVYSS